MAFVKFSRGLISSYNNLSRKDPDTLYLVYETSDSENGLLYLGNKLISTVGNNSSIALSDLADVALNGTPEDGMILQYNAHTAGQVGEEGKWEAVSLASFIENLPGADSSNISIEEALENIENPNDKDLAVIGQDVYIYSEDEGDWVQLTDSSLASRISDLEEQVGHASDSSQNIAATGLYKEIEDLKENVYTKAEIASQLANIDHLRYEIVSDISDIDLSSEDRDNTVYLVPKQSEDNTDGYDEYFVIDNELEKIGSWDVDLSNYVQNDDSRLLSQSQIDKLDAITLDNNGDIVINAAQVTDLNQAIQQNQLIKSVHPGTFEVTDEGQLQLVSVPSIDLSGYVQTSVYQAEVGDLSELQNRVSPNSTLVQEINSIKTSVIWQELINQNNNG